MAPRYKIDHFKETELLVDITEHTLVPVHKVLTREEKIALLKRYKLKDSQLPRMQVSDPIARYFCLPLCDLCSPSMQILWHDPWPSRQDHPTVRDRRSVRDLPRGHVTKLFTAGPRVVPLHNSSS